jgi:uncharacterized protein DUF5719
VTGRLTLVAVAGLVAGSAVIGSLHGARPTLVAADDLVVPLRPHTAASQDSAPASTWYCAAAVATVSATDPASALPGMVAPNEHVVVVANTTAEPVQGRVTVYGGDMAPRPELDDESALATSPTSPSTTSPATTPPSSSTTSSTSPPGGPVHRPFQLGPHSRISVSLGELQPSPVTAAVVEADRGGVAVEQQLTGTNGGDVAPCASAPASSWHFAWGSTARTARELLVLFNPFPSDVSLDGVFTSEDGVREPLRWQGLQVPARSVLAVDVGEDVTRRELLAATVLADRGGLVVSRVQALADGPTGGLSLAVGQPSARPSWTFVQSPVDDGTGQRLALYNPSNRDAEVEVAVRDVTAPDAAAQPLVPFEVTVRAGSIETLDLGAQERLVAGAPRTTTVWTRNGVPVVAERVLQHPARLAGTSTPSAELSAGGGSYDAATRWISPVVVQGDAGATRYVVANVDPFHPAQVSVAVDGGSAGQTRPAELQQLTVPPSGQIEIVLPAIDGLAPSDTATVIVEATLPVVAERAVFQGDALRSLSPLIPVDQ